MAATIKSGSLNASQIQAIKAMDSVLHDSFIASIKEMQKIDGNRYLLSGDYGDTLAKIVKGQVEGHHAFVQATWKQRGLLVRMILNHFGFENDKWNPNSYRNSDKPGIEVFVEWDLNQMWLLVSDIERCDRCLGVSEVLELLKMI